MKDFFSVISLEKISEYTRFFPVIGTETIHINDSTGRIIAEDIISDMDIPGFDRSTMDGYAVRASSTFGASEANPAYLIIKGSIPMGIQPSGTIGSGEAVRIATGGMLPKGADGVVMVEHASEIDASTLEVYKSIAPGNHVITKGEDIRKGQIVISAGAKIRPQETGLLAALGRDRISVFKKPVIGIISTGDEIVPINVMPELAQVRDINTYTLTAMIIDSGGSPVQFGLVADNHAALLEKCIQALEQSDILIISGGSSVGTRDLTIDVIKELPDSEILVHGISISPGKPTILARAGQKQLWGLPGHVTSAMIVYDRVVRPFVAHVSGIKDSSSAKKLPITAKLNRNVPSAQGRVDFIRVRLTCNKNEILAEPLLGKSGLLNTMLKADGLLEIDINTEGLDKGALVSVIPF